MIIDGDTTTAVSGEELDFDMMTVTPSSTQIVDEIENHLADTRNKYVIYSVDVFNSSTSEINVIDSLKIELSYAPDGNEHLFDTCDIMLPGEKSSILGEWTAYETNLKTLETKSFDVGFSSIDQNGKLDMYWGGYIPENPTWDEATQVLKLDNLQSFRYEQGVLGGGGGDYRSVLFRKNIYKNPDSFSLMPLEKETYQYIFKVPDLVAENITECETKICVDDEEVLVSIEIE